MNLKIFLYLVPVFMSACGSGIKSGPNDPNETKLDTSSKTLPVDLNGCYLMNIGKDTAKLHLEVEGIHVSGTLSYKRFEKDSNSGTIDGIIEGEKIKLWYRFASEGKISVREVYFKIVGGKLAEGYGDIGLRNDTAIFKYPSTLNYEEKHPYLKTACE